MHRYRTLTHIRYQEFACHAPRARRCRASASAEQPVNSAARKLEFNDRIGALREWEKALQDSSLSNEQRKVLLYNCAAVHANMGDLELAQVCERVVTTPSERGRLLYDKKKRCF
jgi:hypothetical protein